MVVGCWTDWQATRLAPLAGELALATGIDTRRWRGYQNYHGERPGGAGPTDPPLRRAVKRETDSPLPARDRSEGE